MHAPVPSIKDLAFHPVVVAAPFGQEHDVDHGDFPQEVLDCVAEYSDDWAPPPEELAKRTDLRSLRIFSIDPTTAKDLDDALSIEWDEDKQLFVNVCLAVKTAKSWIGVCADLFLTG